MASGTNFVSTAEVATLLGVSRQRVHQLRGDESARFPKPVIMQPKATFWRRRDIERWGRKHGYMKQEG
jgi:predicted DNA-binding transcriptional regulator AlpA